MKISFIKALSWLKNQSKKSFKAIVRRPYHDEVITTDSEWSPKQVVQNPYCRLAYFTNGEKQEKHVHPEEIEIYTILRGKVKIQVEDEIFELEEKDSLVVEPGKNHQVIDEGDYLVQVISCGLKGKKT